VQCESTRISAIRKKCKAKCEKLPLPHSSKFYVQTVPPTGFSVSTETSYSITGVKVIGDMCHHNERIFKPVPFFSAKLNIKTIVN
jgi:hypothetical protein